MKALMLISILGALSLPAAAQTTPAPSDQQQQVVPVKGNEYQIDVSSGRHKMWPSDYYSYINNYSLSNGMTLSIFKHGDSMYASVDNTPHKIAAISPNTFVALDQQLKMHINLLDNGDVSGDVLMVVPAQKLSDGTIQKEQLLYVAMR